MNKRIVVGLAFAGSIGLTTLAYAAGLFPDYPVVGGATYCAGTSSTATGTIIGAITGCPNQVPAGPTIVTGSEQIPADTRLSGGAAPQTVLIPMAALNALPITVSQANKASANSLTATNTTGGLILWAPPTGINTISSLNVFLPLNPIDGQQFVLGSNLTITTLVVSPGNVLVQTVSNSPSVLTMSTTADAGYRFMWNAATSTWYRLQ